MSADDCDSARKAVMGLCFELFILRQEVTGKKPDLAALRCWWERAESEGIAAYRTVEPWLDPLAAAREGLCREGSLVGSSAADVILRLWTRGRLIAGEALEAVGEKGNLVWRCLEAPNPGDVELDDEEVGGSVLERLEKILWCVERIRGFLRDFKYEVVRAELHSDFARVKPASAVLSLAEIAPETMRQSMSHPALAPGQTLEQKIQPELNCAVEESRWEAALREDPEAAWRTLEANHNAGWRAVVAAAAAAAAAAPAADVAGLTAVALGLALHASCFADGFRVVAALPVADRSPAAYRRAVTADWSRGVVAGAAARDAAGALSAAAHGSWEQSVKVLARRLSETSCPLDKTSLPNQFSESEEAEATQGTKRGATPSAMSDDALGLAREAAVRCAGAVGSLVNAAHNGDDLTGAISHLNKAIEFADSHLRPHVEFIRATRTSSDPLTLNGYSAASFHELALSLAVRLFCIGCDAGRPLSNGATPDRAHETRNAITSRFTKGGLDVNWLNAGINEEGAKAAALECHRRAAGAGQAEGIAASRDQGGTDRGPDGETEIQAQMLPEMLSATRRHGGQTTKRKGGRPRIGESEKKRLIIGALAKHHRYQPPGGAENYTPAKGKEIAELASNKIVKVSASTVSRFFKKMFPKHDSGYAGYVAACNRDAKMSIAMHLALWQGEVGKHFADLLPHEYGRPDDD